MNAVAPCGCALTHMGALWRGGAKRPEGNAMNRRTLLLGLLGGLAAAPAIIAAASSVEAAPLPEVLPSTPAPLPEPASASAVTEADLDGVKPDWSRYYHRGVRRVGRRTARRVSRRRY